MRLPEPRGPLSDAIIRVLTAEQPALPTPSRVADAVHDGDVQLALWTCYELLYRGFDEVSDDLERDAEIVTFRRQLETIFVAALRAEVPVGPISPDAVVAVLDGITSNGAGPSLSAHLRRDADPAALTDLVAQRSVAHLREADPYTFAIPRLAGSAKAALVAIQADKYGDGNLRQMNSTPFADLMAELGLDTTYGAYVDRVPGITLATTNLLSLFAINRRWRGALVGHLAIGERDVFGVPDGSAGRKLCAEFVAQEPQLAPDVIFGAACATALETHFANHLITAWSHGRSSLRALQQSAA